jgi:cytochrome oxidase Cu insertion factor (SCO1/SenC/PrrC family)
VSAESESAPAEVPAEVPAGTGDPPTRAGLSDAERAAAFSSGRAPVDRTAALRAGSVPVPRKFVLWVIVGFAVLGLGGLIAEHVVGDAGVESAITTPLTTLGGAAPPSIPAAPTGPSVGASPAAVIGLKHLAVAPAPALDLTDQHRASWTLGQARGKVVVLTFVNAECNDICPVLAGEIAQADRLLGPGAASVDFVVVNTDPLETSLVVTPPVLTRTGLGGLPNVIYLTGSLPDLSRVWKAYGVTVAVGNTTRLVTHNDVMDFIDPVGRLALQATPFGDESALGAYSLDPATVHAFAQGVAAAADGLAPRQP